MARRFKRDGKGRFAGGGGGSRSVNRAKKSADRKLKKLQVTAAKTQAIQRKNGGLSRRQVSKYVRTGRSAVKAQKKYVAAAQKAQRMKSTAEGR